MIKHYFTCANSSKGFQNYFSSNLCGLDKIYILKGGPGSGKSTLMKKVGQMYHSNNYDVEFIHCSSDVDSLDGVIIRKLGVAIVDGTSPHVIEPIAPGAIEQYVHLGDAWDIDKLTSNKESILLLQVEIANCYSKVYELYAKAKKVHDEWENIYIANMDFEAANQLAKKLIELIFDTTDEVEVDEGYEYHRFFGAPTGNGPVDFVLGLTDPIQTRYFIKGRPGTGKSSMLRKIVKESVSRGFETEVYHCAFDPDSLDMVLIPALDVCIFDSTSPHEYFPQREGDIIVDVYQEAVEPNTDEKFEDELKDISSRYRTLTKEAASYLAKAKCLHDDLEKIYVSATDFNKVTEIRKALIGQIQKIQLSKILDANKR